MKIAYLIITAPAKGKRVSEDAYVVLPQNGFPFFAAVVDGHGPVSVHFNGDISDFARFVALTLGSLFKRVPRADKLSELFSITQFDVEQTYGPLPFGAVASCVMIDAFGVTLAQAGDCQLYRFAPNHPNGYELLTQDHCVDNPIEIQRLRPFYESGRFASLSDDAGDYFVEQRLHYKDKHGNWSESSLMPTRGFGDPEFHPAFTHVPEVRSISFDTGQETLFALCSDGGSKTVQQAFKHVCSKQERFNELTLKRIADAVRLFVPEKPEDDVTIILINIFPHPTPTSF